MDRHHLAGNLAVKRDRVNGRNSAQGIHIDVDIAGFRLANGDGRGLLRAAVCSGLVVFRRGRTSLAKIIEQQNRQ